MTTIGDAFDKLFAADAIRIAENKEPSFTIQFLNYISIYSEINKDNLQHIQGWRNMLAGFHLSLIDLTDEELAMVVTLLDYQHQAAKAFTVNI